MFSIHAPSTTSLASLHLERLVAGPCWALVTNSPGLFFPSGRQMMLTQSVRRVQPGKRISSLFAKPGDSLESELWLEQGGSREGVFTELAGKIFEARAQCHGFHGNPLL